MYVKSKFGDKKNVNFNLKGFSHDGQLGLKLLRVYLFKLL